MTGRTDPLKVGQCVVIPGDDVIYLSGLASASQETQPASGVPPEDHLSETSPVLRQPLTAVAGVPVDLAHLLTPDPGYGQ